MQYLKMILEHQNRYINKSSEKTVFSCYNNLMTAFIKKISVIFKKEIAINTIYI